MINRLVISNYNIVILPLKFPNVIIVFIDKDILECTIIHRLNYHSYLSILYIEFVKSP